MIKFSETRRAFLGSAATGLATVALATSAKATASVEGGDFAYEVTRTEAEWHALLTKDEYYILRKGGTELPKSSDLWDETAKGIYSCKGCSLQVFDSAWKSPLDMGWVFFYQSSTNALLTGIEGTPPTEYGMKNGPPTMIEVHCRRCGSHIGHILKAKGEVLYCCDGAAMTFQPESA